MSHIHFAPQCGAVCSWSSGLFGSVNNRTSVRENKQTERKWSYAFFSLWVPISSNLFFLVCHWLYPGRTLRSVQTSCDCQRDETSLWPVWFWKRPEGWDRSYLHLHGPSEFCLLGRSWVQGLVFWQKKNKKKLLNCNVTNRINSISKCQISIDLNKSLIVMSFSLKIKRQENQSSRYEWHRPMLLYNLRKLSFLGGKFWHVLSDPGQLITLPTLLLHRMDLFFVFCFLRCCHSNTKHIK